MKTIKEMRTALDNKEVSAMELADSCLKAIKDDVYLYVDEEATRKMAKEAQAKIDAGEKTPLLGVPIGLMDVLCTIDMPTTCASKFLDGYISPYDATVVRKLRETGAVFTGKLNMDEFGMYGGTANGSSAKAVASGMCAASLGLDTGGAVRQIAANAGITGLRPTYGMVSRYGVVAYASSFDQIGPMAQTAEDCGILLDVIAGHDANDMTSAAKAKCRDAVNSAKGLRIGVIDELMNNVQGEEAYKTIADAIEWYKQNGAEIKHISMTGNEYCLPAYKIIACAEASANLARLDGVRYGRRTKEYNNFEELIEKSRGEGFGYEVKKRILLGVHVLTSGNYDAYYTKARQYRNLVKAEYKEAFNTVDAIICPMDTSSSIGVSLAGLPAVSTNGVQIIGNRFDDRFILSLASLYESKEAGI
jgi:aspartyl-tRNA(Asn)/glutamyl-tRNA(Gln) amidotransferase subunit A